MLNTTVIVLIISWIVFKKHFWSANKQLQIGNPIKSKIYWIIFDIRKYMQRYYTKYFYIYIYIILNISVYIYHTKYFYICILY